MAQIYLTQQEFTWLERWLQLREKLQATDNRFFTTGTQTNGMTLLTSLRTVWDEMGLPGRPTFTDIRTSVATAARDFHSPDDRHRLARFMCHDTATSDRFYALHLTTDQCRAIRDLFERPGRTSVESP